MAPWWGQWKAPWWGWIFQWRCRCPEDMRFLMVWGNVWRVVGTEYVRRIMVGIFRGKSRLAEVSPDKTSLHCSETLYPKVPQLPNRHSIATFSTNGWKTGTALQGDQE